MKNHGYPDQPRDANGTFEPAHPERFVTAQKTWVSILTNLALTFFQVVGGFLAHSQALMAEGLHSLSDLLSDTLVLFANRHGNRYAPGLLAHLAGRLEEFNLMDKRLVFHYLDGKVDAEIFLVANQHPSEQTDALQARCNELVREGGLFRSIHVHRNHAQG